MRRHKCELIDVLLEAILFDVTVADIAVVLARVNVNDAPVEGRLFNAVQHLRHDLRRRREEYYTYVYKIA